MARWLSSHAGRPAQDCTKRRIVHDEPCKLLLGELTLERVRGGWWRRRQRGGIEQNVPTCDNIEQVIPLSPIHIIR
jgi:hypothetical protein